MKIGNFIREKRQQKGLTQEELALRCEITVRTIQRIENGEVDPRSYTLQAIASALEIEFQELVNADASSAVEDRSRNESYWLAILHFSSIVFLVIPSVFIWALKKDTIPNIRSHAIDAINFQISMILYLMIAAVLCLIPLPIPFSKSLEIPALMAAGVLLFTFLGIFGSTIIMINTSKAVNNQSYRYPLSMRFLKR